jgi:hydroxyethylthiazole kinase
MSTFPAHDGPDDMPPVAPHGAPRPPPGSAPVAERANLQPYAAIGPERVAALMRRLRAEAPRVHSLTNVVAQNFTANLLLAAGAVPSMTVAPDEVTDFATRSDAVLINIGTLDSMQHQAIPLAIAAAEKAGKPWAFDPALIDRSELRLTLALHILAQRPTMLRCNGAEFAALDGNLADEPTVRAFAARHGVVVAITGDVDMVTDGTRLVRIANGHPLMGRVTAVSCAETALVAALMAVEPDALAATVAGLAMLGIAGEMAAERAIRPGSFAVALLDAIDGLDEAAIRQRLRIIT